MKLYTCNACHLTFPAEALPDHCPDCGRPIVNLKTIVFGCEILRGIPAVREANDIEAAEYERIKKEIVSELDAEQEQKNIESFVVEYTIRFITLLLQHKLRQDEHNMALMIGYHFLYLPTYYAKGFIHSVLEPDQADRIGGVAAFQLPDGYEHLRRRFLTSMLSEKRKITVDEYQELYWSTWEEGIQALNKDSVRVLPTKDNLNPDTPALNFMKYAVCNEPVPSRKAPNIGVLKSIRCNQIAGYPSDEYLAFLRDWYNMI